MRICFHDYQIVELSTKVLHGSVGRHPNYLLIDNPVELLSAAFRAHVHAFSQEYFTVIQRRSRVRTSSAPSPLLAVLTTTALAVTAVFGGNSIVNTQSDGGEDIEVANATTSLAEGDTVVLDDAPAAQTQDDSANAVKEITRDEEFSQFALTWEGDKEVDASVRALRADGTWSEWYDLDPIQAESTTGINGTDLIYIEPTNTVQVAMGNVDLVDPEVETPEAEAPVEEAPAADGILETDQGAIQPMADVVDTSAETTAEDFDVVTIDGGTGTTDAIAPMSVVAGVPNVVTRAQWGAGSGLRCGNPSYTAPTKAITVHHTAGSNNYTRAAAPGIVRGIYQYHADTLGWCDVGYNAMVDKYGTLYEGRYGGLSQSIMGAHVGGFNQNTWAISALGNYETAVPTNAMINAMSEMIGWRAAQAGWDPTGTTQLTSNYTFTGTKYPAGTTGTFPRVNAHRDFHANACPGQNLYNQMSTIRSKAKAKYNSVRAMVGASATTTANAPTTTNRPATTTATTTSPAPAPAPAGGNNEPSPAIGDLTDALGSSDAVDSRYNGQTMDTTTVVTAVGAIAAIVAVLAAVDATVPGGLVSLANGQAPNLGAADLAGVWNAVQPLIGAGRGLTLL